MNGSDDQPGCPTSTPDQPPSDSIDALGAPPSLTVVGMCPAPEADPAADCSASQSSATATTEGASTEATESTESSKRASAPPASELSSSAARGPPPVGGRRWLLQDLPRVVWRIIGFCQLRAVAALLATSKRFRALSEHNTPWLEILRRLHLDVLLPPRCDEVYGVFLASIRTLRSLHGVYEFMSGKLSDPSFNISAARLTVAPAELGFLAPVARVTLKVIFTGGEAELFYGAMRYSVPRTMFLINTIPAGVPRLSGPSFDVMAALAKRPWANENRVWFRRQQGLPRLILTVSSLGQQRLSQIGMNGIIAVTKRPEGCKHSIDGPMRKATLLTPLK